MKKKAELRRILNWLFSICWMVFMTIIVGGCGATETRPVDIFAEDNCAQCRMAISDERFASEIIDQNDEVIKFDDLGCMLTYRAKHADLRVHAIFLKDFDSKQWTSYERASIVETNVETPMGSGKVAFTDTEKAKAFQKQYPKIVLTGGIDKCCE